ncbi:MAG TPA: hypothetical protein VNV37_03990 [Solirubrobacteraceae bacterium]|jgi:hypothetical protein|nr:hypothetical protein [Solirubrobacteraceae bacterium]
MELQDFAPHLLVTQLVCTNPSAAVIDQRGKWIATLRDEFGATEFAAEGAAVEAFSDDRREQYRVGTAQVVGSIENFDEIKAAGDKLGRFVERALDRLERPHVAQVRVRTFELAATDSFAELRDALGDALGTPRGELADIVGRPMTDAGWVLEFMGGSPLITLRFGPMKASQIKTFLRDQRDSQYPGEFLFLDVDYVQTGEDLDPAQAVERLATSIESNRRLVHRVAKWLTEKLNS